MNRYSFLVVCSMMLLSACHKHHDHIEEPQVNERTVLVYMAGDNNLKDFIRGDIRQMMTGSEKLSKRQRLILFVDQYDRLPYLMEVAQGDTTRLMTYDEEQKSSDAKLLRDVLLWTMEHYEAESYGLVLWGHADGWVVKNQAASALGPRKAYGQDVTGSEGWMEISDMACQLQSLPTKLKFIFADCCCFQSVESAYELRDATDYIIASAAEIPGEGAPYQTVVPAMFNSANNFYEGIADAYFQQVTGGCQEPLSVIKTSEMENLAHATGTILQACVTPLVDDKGYPNVDSLIYYYDHTLFDMNDFIRRIADDNQYVGWKRVFDAAVPYRLMTATWVANHIKPNYSTDGFADFEVTEERYGGVSMFVAQSIANGRTIQEQSLIRRQNATISRMQWYKAASLDLIGW